MDSIALRLPYKPSYDSIINTKLDALCEFYKVKVEKSSKPLSFNTFTDFEGLKLDGALLESDMKKYYDEDNKTIYLLYNKNEKKVGYSIYVGTGDYLLDTYGMKQWVNGLPSVSINKDELVNYMLIAL